MNSRTIIAACVAVALMSLMACTKDTVQYKAGENLGQIYLSPQSGVMSVMVSLEGLWRVKTDSGWIHLDSNGADGKAAFSFTYDENKSDMIFSKEARKADIIIQRVSQMVSDTLVVIQQGAPDGNRYVSVEKDNYIEFIVPQLKTVRLLYANLAGSEPQKTISWLQNVSFDWAATYDPDNYLDGTSDNLLREGAFAVATQDIMPEKVFSDELSLTVTADGWNLVVANYSESADKSEQYRQMKDLLDRGYNQPFSGDFWIIGGSLYHLSISYPETPSWYPLDPADAYFDADRYAWQCNLFDSIYLTHRGFNSSFSSDGRSWRADYAYMSSSAWNHLVAVEEVPVSESGLQHVAYVLTLKY